MVTIAYDEKPDIQALALTTPDRPPVHGQHPSHLRDYECKRLGTVSLWAGLDLHTGTIIETVSDSMARIAREIVGTAWSRFGSADHVHTSERRWLGQLYRSRWRNRASQRKGGLLQ